MKKNECVGELVFAILFKPNPIIVFVGALLYILYMEYNIFNSLLSLMFLFLIIITKSVPETTIRV